MAVRRVCWNMDRRRRRFSCKGASEVKSTAAGVWLKVGREDVGMDGGGCSDRVRRRICR